MTVRLLHIDAFTAEPFAGNPAAVCLFVNGRGDAWMQKMAAEMNLAETAFVERRSAPGEFGLRWFTPMVEVPLCGHATLASAHALWQLGEVARDRPITFHTKLGPLHTRLTPQGIVMDFPAIATEVCAMPGGLSAMLGAEVVHCERSPVKYVAEVATAQEVGLLRPDFAAIARLDRSGVIVTARSMDGTCDFVSRFFAPQIGVPEDPVTGSAHCVLATYWAARLKKNTFRARQLSPRGGDVGVELQGGRVLLTGHAVTVFRAELC